MMSANIRAATMASTGTFRTPEHQAAAKYVPRSMPVYPHGSLPFPGAQYGQNQQAMPSYMFDPTVFPGPYGMMGWQQQTGASPPMVSYMAPQNPFQMPNFKTFPSQTVKKVVNSPADTISQSSSSLSPPTPTPVGRRPRQAIPAKPAGVKKAVRYDNRATVVPKKNPTTPKAVIPAPKAAIGTPPKTPENKKSWKPPAKGPKTPPTALLLSETGCEDWQLNMARDLGLQDIAGPFEIGDALYVIQAKCREVTKLANRRRCRNGRFAWLRAADAYRLEEKAQQLCGEPVGMPDGSFQGFKGSETTLVKPYA